MPKRIIPVTEKGIQLPSGVVKTVESGRYEPDSRSTLHSHTNLQVFFVIEGKGSLQFPLRRCFVHPGDVVLVNANELHTEYSSQNKHLEYIALELDHLEILPKTSVEHGFLQIHHADFSQLLALVHIIRNELEQQRPGYLPLCNHLAESLLLFLLREGNFDLLHIQRGEKDCQIVHSYIERHFAEQISLDSLSALISLNKFHLSHIFKEYYGYSINNHLQSCRIREATRLLRETKLSTTEIGRMVGFNTPCHFNTVFREHMKTTPAVYRKANQKA